VGPSHPPIQWVMGDLFPEVKAVGAWNWSLTSILCRGQEWWNYISTLTYVFMVWCLIESAEKQLYRLPLTFFRTRLQQLCSRHWSPLTPVNFESWRLICVCNFQSFLPHNTVRLIYFIYRHPPPHLQVLLCESLIWCLLPELLLTSGGL
jgi:hypothetical protein